MPKAHQCNARRQISRARPASLRRAFVVVLPEQTHMRWCGFLAREPDAPVRYSGEWASGHPMAPAASWGVTVDGRTAATWIVELEKVLRRQVGDARRARTGDGCRYRHPAHTHLDRRATTALSRVEPVAGPAIIRRSCRWSRPPGCLRGAACEERRQAVKAGVA